MVSESSLSKQEGIGSNSDKPEKSEEDFMRILNEYRDLLEIQALEREELLIKVDDLSKQSENANQIDSKMDHLLNLLLDIRQQIGSITDNNPELPSQFASEINVVASDDQIKELSDEIEIKGEALDTQIGHLQNQLEDTRSEIIDKNLYIEKLNSQIQILADEKVQLILKLEELTNIANSWNKNIDLLQKLAKSDPRYKTINTLKKHGRLSEIQLAFSMGTSISQVRKYAEDLIDLGLVQKDKLGRYVWVGKNE